MTKSIMINLPRQLRNSAKHLFGIIIMTTPEAEKTTPPKVAETLDEALVEIGRFETQAEENLIGFLTTGTPFNIQKELKAAQERIAVRDAKKPSPTEQLEQIIYDNMLHGMKGINLTTIMKKRREELGLT